MAKKQQKATRRKTNLYEGFLDGADDEVKTPEEAPVETSEEEGAEGAEEENDIAEEPIDDSELDGNGDGEADDAASDEEAGVEPEGSEAEDNLQDTLQTLITAVQGLTDQIAKQNGEGGDDESTGDDDSAGAETSDEETAEPEEDDSDFEGDEETSEESSDEESSEESGEEESSDEESSDDETTNEMLKPFYKRGKMLHEDSSYLLGKLAHYRFDKLEPIIMAIVESKIRRRIEGAKTQFRQEAIAARLNGISSDEE